MKLQVCRRCMPHGNVRSWIVGLSASIGGLQRLDAFTIHPFNVAFNVGWVRVRTQAWQMNSDFCLLR